MGIEGGAQMKKTGPTISSIEWLPKGSQYDSYVVDEKCREFSFTKIAVSGLTTNQHIDLLRCVSDFVNSLGSS